MNALELFLIFSFTREAYCNAPPGYKWHFILVVSCSNPYILQFNFSSSLSNFHFGQWCIRLCRRFYAGNEQIKTTEIHKLTPFFPRRREANESKVVIFPYRLQHGLDKCFQRWYLCLKFGHLAGGKKKIFHLQEHHPSEAGGVSAPHHDRV